MYPINNPEKKSFKNFVVEGRNAATSDIPSIFSARSKINFSYYPVQVESIVIPPASKKSGGSILFAV